MLASELASLIAADPAEPFVAERVVVPHQTLGRWLRLEIARELGIAANIDFELPAEFAWSILRGAVPTLSKARGFAPNNLRWHLFELLPEFARSADAAELRRYLADGDERKRFELSGKLADVFDRCVNFRPDWIREWERGGTPHWQARLWRLLAEKVPERHWVHALDAFERELAGGLEPENWPRRAFVFGVSAFSPSYLQLLKQLAAHIELHVFLFNPSSEYWSDLRAEKEIRRLAENGDAVEQHFEEGNRLLAAWGRAGRFTFENLIATEDEARSLFLPPDGGTRLASLQADILEVRDPTEAGSFEAVAPDSSLQIHCCHSPMREAEALHDRLLDLLEHNADIEPADIMILTPNLARYGPAVAAVFEAEGHIPIGLSRFRAADSPTARAFFDLMSLPGTRYGVEAVLAPLDAPSLRARFGIHENSLPAIRRWVGQAGIRRGVTPDGGEQAPAMPGNTWIEGLRRLLMGYAAGDTEALALGVAPCSIQGEGGFDAGEESYATLGRFISFCDAAFALRNDVARPRAAKQWTALLHRTLEKFFDKGSVRGAYRDFEAMREAADEFAEVGGLIGNFADQAGRVDCPIPFEVVRQTLMEAAVGPALGPARLADGATIGRLAPGQTPPAKIVCAMGMNGDGFPRNPPRHTFDPVERDKRRHGDRDVRHEDRFAFLEALLAARKAFIVTYTGRDQRDDSEIPPSVLVDELSDYLALRFPEPGIAGESGKPGEKRGIASGRWRIDHPLQAFSPRYFSGGDRLFSYSRTMLEAAKILRGPGGKSRHRFAVELPEPGASRRKVDLAELAAFFADPARVFLKERFGISLSEAEQAIDEVEPLSLDGLQHWGLREEINGRTGEKGVKPEAARSLLLARGNMPYGGFGESIYDDAFSVVDRLQRALAPYLETLAAEPAHIDRRIGEFHLTGVISNIGADHLFYWRNGSFRAKDRIEVRLSQLAWMAAGNEPLPATVLHLERGAASVATLDAPDPNAESIGNWMEAWWRGLSTPLRFFPESSLACAEQLAKGAEGKAISAARLKWRGHYRQTAPSESENPHNRLVWNLDEEDDPFSEEFAGLAKALLAPMCGGAPQ